MKKLLWLALMSLIVLFTGCAQPAPKEKMFYDEVVIHKLNQKDAHEKSKMWLANAFVDSKEVIEYDNKDYGTVIGKGAFKSVNYGMMVDARTTFTLKIEVKDGKSRITFSDMYVPQYYSGNIKIPGYNLWNLDQLESFKMEARDLVKNYSDNMNGISDIDQKSDW